LQYIIENMQSTCAYGDVNVCIERMTIPRGKIEGCLSCISPLQVASKMSYSITEYQPLLPNAFLAPNNIKKQR
jgi:hypothetical protein